MPGRARVIVRCSGNLTRQLLECLTLRLRDQQRREDAQEHEQGEDLHDVVEPWGGVLLGDLTLGAERAEYRLRDDGADLAGRGGQAVRGGAVAGGETLAGNDEGRSVRAKVEEELAQNVKSEQSTLRELVVGEANNAEEDGEEGEAHQLNRLAANCVDCSNRHPVSWNGTCADNDQVADGGVAEDVIHVAAAGVTNSSQNDGVVETKTVKCNVARTY